VKTECVLIAENDLQILSQCSFTIGADSYFELPSINTLPKT